MLTSPGQVSLRIHTSSESTSVGKNETPRGAVLSSEMRVLHPLDVHPCSNPLRVGSAQQGPPQSAVQLEPLMSA